jgi:hypothetical protein
MKVVIIQYKNTESTVRFKAQEFDIDLSKGKNQSTGSDRNNLTRFTYQDETGAECPIFLNLAEVAGIAVVTS